MADLGLLWQVSWALVSFSAVAEADSCLDGTPELAKKHPGLVARRVNEQQVRVAACCLLLAACCLLGAWCLVLACCLLLAARCSVLAW